MARVSKKYPKRLSPRFVVPLVIVVVLAGAVALYAAQGNDPRDFPRDAAARLQILAGRARQASQDAVASVEPAHNSGEPSEHIALYFAPGTRLRGGDIDDALLAYLRSARKSIRCAFYDFEYVEAAKVLVEKHKDGLEVGIVSDSGYKDRDAVQLCIQAGIPVVFDERRPFMHDKFCIVDDSIVWTGSTNITENCLFRNDNNSLKIVSAQLAEDYTAEFREMFDTHKFGPRSPRGTPYKDVQVDGIAIRCLFAPEDGVRDEILREIQDANTSITFMAFSFTSAEIAKAMAERIKDGVKVRGLFEKRNAGSAYSEDEFLARRGAEIHMDTNSNTMHNKVIVVDAEVVITGSYNFSANAEKDNDENVLILRSRGIAEQYEAQYRKLVN
ncbi:MAG: phospholipase D-like domain-containing protein [Candidatus Hydrogenedentales bacterium]|jgi:phosphatidylserine/phosphatidylglycerophosphate/cardiolipin synthase-like enzyme